MPSDSNDNSVFLGNALCGAISGACSRFCVAPLDLAKIRLQIQVSGSSQQSLQYTSMSQMFRTVVRDEGFSSLWKGNLIAEVMVVSYSSVQFATYQANRSFFKTYFPARFSAFESLVSGATAGVVATIATYPLDLLRTRFAAQQEPKIYRSVRDALSQILARDGWRGLYVGLWPTVVGIFPYSAIQFGSYEAFKDYFIGRGYGISDGEGKLRCTPMASVVCGFMSGLAAKIGTYPLDVARRRFQVSGFQFAAKAVVSHHKYRGLIECISLIVRNEGIASLYRGSVPSIIKSALSTAISFSIFDMCQQKIKENHIFN
eukprot:TRINITY_DN5169_c0_g1_i4.p1 TRINITY_DN5169_c0_g1~~TRINITY_DN5169_c0_g1_i4.p1  ORF type:complete len:316 (+),score=27.65 TRINITY_DN5169_c0_g1_i4:79-1026(+)